MQELTTEIKEKLNEKISEQKEKFIEQAEKILPKQEYIPSEEIDYKPYFFFKNRTWLLTSFALFSAGLLITELMLSVHNGSEYIGWGGVVAILTAVVFIISSLGGYATAANMVFVAFVIETIKMDSFAFHAYVIFLPACVAILPIRRGWYHSIKKAWLALLWLPISFSIGFIPFSVYIGFSLTLEFWLWVVLFALGPSLFMTIFGVLFFKFVPVRVRKLFKSYFYENEQKYKVLRRRPEISEVLEKKCSVPLAFKVVVICFLGILIASLGSAVLSTIVMPTEFLSPSVTMNEWNRYTIESLFVCFLFIATLLANVINLLYGILTVPLTIITKAFRDSSHSIARAKKRDEIHTLELPVDSHDEIGVLYDALHRSEKHVIAYLESVEREINLQNDLKVANAASEAKSTFLSSMSHEIRSPINAVLGLDEMIIRESHETEIKSYATDIQSSGKMLLSIINDILDFSKIEAGKMEIIPVDYDMSAVISDLVNMIEARATKKGLAFIVNVDEKMPHLLHGDDTRLKQCILNILTNAVKYTPQGSVTLTISSEQLAVSSHSERSEESQKGEVSPSLQTQAFSATPSAGTPRNAPNQVLITISVKDTGIGIKQEDIKKLFSPFERIEEGRNRAIEGTGLGMSIVKSLLASMGTQLDVQSVYGKGSDFSFKIVQEVRDWEPIGNYAETKKRLQEAASVYTESFQAPEAKILVVDDTPINLTVMKGLLKQTLVQIDTAESGATALERAKSQKYDVIFIDHMMPKMDGLQLLAELRKSPTNELSVVSEIGGSETSTVADGQTNGSSETTNLNLRTPCIALTANAMDGIKAFYQNAGFEDYLSKPIDSKKLEEILQEYLPSEKVQVISKRGEVRSEELGMRNEKLEIKTVISTDEEKSSVISSVGSDPQSGTKPVRQVLSESPSNYVATALVESRNLSSPAESFLRNRFGIDLSLALKNCGGEDVFMEAAENFYDAIDEKSNLIEEYAKSGDWKNYTILVHALKSSARLIGASELSDLAKELEAAGDKAQKIGETENGNRERPDRGKTCETGFERVSVKAVPEPQKNENDGENVAQNDSDVSLSGLTRQSSATSTLAQKTPALLADYRAYKAKLASLLGKSVVSMNSTTATAKIADSDVSLSDSIRQSLAPTKPEISQTRLADALSALREVVSVFDFDSADSIIKELDGYTIPTGFAEQFAKIRKAVRDVDQAKVMELLGQ